MKNDDMKKHGQFQNVRVEYGFGAVCQWKHTFVILLFSPHGGIISTAGALVVVVV